MPNHTANLLTVLAPKDGLGRLTQIKELMYYKDDDGETRFNFNKIVAMPKDLEHSRSPIAIKTAEEIAKEQAEQESILARNPKYYMGGLSITQEEYDRRIKEYGSADWYDWCIKHWGTKWNAYSVGEWKDDRLYFETAWSPPSPIIVALSKKFPDCEFLLEFADEGGSFLGSETIVNGEVVKQVTLDWNGREGIEMRKRLERWYEDEEESDDDEKEGGETDAN